ncbi:hypothetical protein F4809DRAFT_494062 [Biscogniauxia mediterranea]|nr:hypothetical protein F4809DRAFT_494062 [Biscogniauxia mediterranea]
MTLSQHTPDQLKEKLIKHCLQTWKSKAYPVTKSEAITLQFSFLEEGKMPPGLVLLDANPKGHLFMPFDMSPPKDPHLLQEMRKLKAAISGPWCASVNAALDRQIMRYGLWKVWNRANGNLSHSSTLETYDKVELIAKYRVMFDFRSASEILLAPKAHTDIGTDTNTNTAPEGHIMVYLLRARGDDRLEIRDFFLMPRDGMAIFHGLLERASNPYGEILDVELEEMGVQIINDPSSEWWCYKLVDSSDIKQPRLVLEEKWQLVNTTEQFKKMMEQIKYSNRSLMVTSARLLPEARRISQLESNNNLGVLRAPMLDPPLSGIPLSEAEKSTEPASKEVQGDGKRKGKRGWDPDGIEFSALMKRLCK